MVLFIAGSRQKLCLEKNASSGPANLPTNIRERLKNTQAWVLVAITIAETLMAIRASGATQKPLLSDGNCASH
jgi:hypothetical protein